MSNDLLRLPVHDVAFGGSGVARLDGKVYFIPFTAPGEVITARVVRDKKKFAEAELVEVEQPSPARVEPRCSYFGRCGGCAYQHLSYEEQLRLKARQVEETLRRVGHFATPPMRPIVAAPEPYAYRNRIRVHAEAGVVGFYAHASHILIDVAECSIATPAVNAALADLRHGPRNDGDYTVAGRTRSAFFEQTNDEVARLLVAAVHDLVRRDQATLIDAFCGAGLFAKYLADLFEGVIGIEENGYAIEQARRSATAKEHYVAGDVSFHLGDILATHPAGRTTVILDPPAIGVSARVVDLLLGAEPVEIVYVSCNPATLARDLALLTKGRYQLQSVTPYDMFPQTAEIEVVAHLVRG
jgi:23S rRNA (uracil1939-C5)-methyltransferase